MDLIETSRATSKLVCLTSRATESIASEFRRLARKGVWRDRRRSSATSRIASDDLTMSRRRKAPRSSGFSLVEVMIVIALVALISAVAIPSLSNVLRSSRDEFPRHLALSLREARDRAMLQHKLLRLRLDFDGQQYWFEEAPANYLKPKAADTRALSERDKEEQKKQETDSFREVTELAKEHQKMPKGLRLMEVISPRVREPIREGVADVYLYDNGNTDGVTIHFEDEEKVRSAIRLHPITGQSKFMLGYEEGKP
jgi:type II secretion system protein H